MQKHKTTLQQPYWFSRLYFVVDFYFFYKKLSVLYDIKLFGELCSACTPQLKPKFHYADFATKSVTYFVADFPRAF